MKKNPRKITDAVEILHRRYVKSRKAEEALEAARVNAEIARNIYDLRKKAKLTQGQLAKLIGTSTSVISRLEDADYSGHSLAMLQRIGFALNKRIEITFVQKKIAA